ncbi:MAG: protein translocase subunit SecD [Candidatus Kapabacteria bacterium]|nr:protein translocase subunit SecD [Candidatus Kapabacteria bacterium]
MVLPLAFGIYILVPTYRAWNLERQKTHLQQNGDSVQLAEFEQLHGATLQSAKQSALKLGLDLRGGMYVTLEVDVIRLLEEAAEREAIDEVFRQVIDATRSEAKRSDEPVLQIFLRNFDRLARPQGRSLISYYDIGDLREVSEENILERLQRNIDGAIDQALEVIRQRVDKYGVAEANIQKQGTRRIVLELPGVTNEAEMRQLLQTTARLEFKLVRNNAEALRSFYAMDQYLKRQRAGRTDTLPSLSDTLPQTTTPVPDTTQDLRDTTPQQHAADTAADPYAGLPEEERRRRIREDFPFTSLFITYYIQNERFVPIDYRRSEFPEGEYFFQIPKESLAEFEALLNRADLQRLLPAEYEVAVSAKPEEHLQRQGYEIYTFYVLKREPELTGDVITDARATFDPTTNAPIVLMDMNTEGAERWARITGANVGKKIAIVLDGRVYSAPVVQTKITGGRSQITGMSSVQEAHLLEIVLKAGALKAPVEIIEERVVGPSLGEDSIRRGLLASLVAFLLVILFMVGYYTAGGAVAIFALLVNIILILSLLSAFKGTLTLPGIAGIILTMGMAVDANILIFERIREELRRGRSIRSAVDEGHKRALSAILDSNVTTFITGLILYFFGTGPIQGFAITLMIGIIMTLFSTLIVARAFIEILLAYDINLYYGLSRKWLVATT